MNQLWFGIVKTSALCCQQSKTEFITAFGIVKTQFGKIFSIHSKTDIMKRRDAPGRTLPLHVIFFFAANRRYPFLFCCTARPARARFALGVGTASLSPRHHESVVG